MVTALDTEPRARVGRSWIAGFGTAWLGVWLAQLAVIQLLLPEQVAMGRSADRFAVLLDFGGVSAAAGVVALVVLPLVGALSDRTVSRFGRRRPWIAGGTAVFAAGLAVLAPQTTLVGIAIGWCIALGGFAALSAALTAVISDRVPAGQRGVVSAWIAVPQAVGTILGLALIEVLGLGQAAAYLLCAALLVVLVLPFLLRAEDAAAGDVPPPALRGLPALPALRAVAGSVWIDPRTHPDFAWTLAGRLLVNLGNALGTTLLLYFLADGLRDGNAQVDLVTVSFVYLLALVVASLVCGRISDGSGARRPFVAIAALLQGAAALLLVLLPALGTTTVAAALLGAGYGVFLSVDQALATQVLPDAASRGKDLGIMTIAQTGPQAFGPLVGAAVVLASGGYGALFAAAAVLSAAGALCVARVRSVR